MKSGTARSFGARLKAFREAAGFTQEELATIAGLSVHAVSALERGERRRPHVETVRALSAALDLSGATRDALLGSARASAPVSAFEELTAAVIAAAAHGSSRPRQDLEVLQEWLAEPGARLITLIGRAASERAVWRWSSLASWRITGSSASCSRPWPRFGSRSRGVRDCRGAGARRPHRADLPNAPVPRAMVTRHAAGARQFEQVLSAAPVIGELLATVPTLRLLVTSRAPLPRQRGARIHRRPLALDTCGRGSDGARGSRARPRGTVVSRTGPGCAARLSLTVANGRTIAEICRRLDAMPLALELAAPWIKC